MWCQKNVVASVAGSDCRLSVRMAKHPLCVCTHMLMRVFYILRKQRHSLFPQNHLLLSLRNDVSSSWNEIDICIDICLHVWCVFTTFMKIHHKNCLFFSFVRRYKKGSCSTGWTYVLHISELCNQVGSLPSRTLSLVLICYSTWNQLPCLTLSLRNCWSKWMVEFLAVFLLEIDSFR